MSLAPTLIFGWGNPSRGDDALGPLLLERLEAEMAGHPRWGAVETLTDFQLQVEHALDLEGRGRVLFVDAAAETGGAPFATSRLEPAPVSGFTSHALPPQAVMRVFLDLTGRLPPPCWLLAIKGESFELGQPLTEAAERHLAAALDWTRHWLDTPAAAWPAIETGG